MVGKKKQTSKRRKSDDDNLDESSHHEDNGEHDPAADHDDKDGQYDDYEDESMVGNDDPFDHDGGSGSIPSTT